MDLGQVAEITSGATPRRDNPHYWGGDIPWLTPTDLPAVGAGVTDVAATADKITEEGLASCSASLLPPGTVLFSSRASIGKVGIAAVPLTTNQGFANLLPRPGVESRYLAWCVHFHADRIAGLAGSTTFKEVSKSALKRFRIPLPAPTEQRRIVEILDRADRLRRLRAEADAKAQRILPALYRNLFLDRASDWPREALGTRLRKSKGALQSGPFGSHLHNSDFVESGPVRVVGIDNVFDGEFSQGRDRRITAEKYQELKKYTLEPGDILLTIMGTVGRSCVFPQLPETAICTKHVYRIQVDERLDPEYASAAIRCDPSVTGQLGASITGQIVAGITSDDIRHLTLLIPPKDLQDRFAAHVRATAQRRIERRRASAQLDRLFQTLLRDAFSGRLTASWRHAHTSELLQEMEHQAKALAEAR